VSGWGQGRQPPEAVARSASLEASRSPGYFKIQLLPGDRAFLSPSSSGYGLSAPGRADFASARLDAGVEASGPHDFTVRDKHRSSARRLFAHRFDKNPPCDSICAPTLPRPPHPVPNVRDDRDTPLCAGRDGGGYRSDLGQEETGIFLQTGLDTRRAQQPVGQISSVARMQPTGRANARPMTGSAMRLEG
jgi:hypothetical protein